MNYENLKVNDYEISLKRLIGKLIKDIYGYVDNELGSTYFKVNRIILKDGSIIFTGGESKIYLFKTTK